MYMILNTLNFYKLYLALLVLKNKQILQLLYSVLG